MTIQLVPKGDPKGDSKWGPKRDPIGDPKGNSKRFMVQKRKTIVGWGNTYYLCSTYVCTYEFG